MVTLRVETTDADAYMNEGVYREGQAGWSRDLGRALASLRALHLHGVLDVDHSQPGTELEIPLLGERRAGNGGRGLSLRPRQLATEDVMP